MKPLDLNSYIIIDEYSSTPKYKQLVNSIYLAIEKGILQKNSPLPSINELSFKLELSRDTAEKGYRQLRKLGIIESVPGKGFFIANTSFSTRTKVCLLFNKLSSHKKIIYDSFSKTLGDRASIDFYVYNNDFTLFKKLLINKKEDYSHYVIIPHFIDAFEPPEDVINMIDKDKLIILDKLIPKIEGQFAAVYEDFSKDIYQALSEALDSLSKYHTIKIIFPENSYFPNEILEGFSRFCNQYAFSYQVINNFESHEIQKGEAYICLMEDDLVELAEKIIALNWKAGNEVGIISYNETPVKRIILDGITTISTDFSMLGSETAKCILNNSREHIKVPFYLNLRSSL
ncbi:GntR family transcriptional regulator [Pedobacter helvus]|uniref:GntR family transcriptional regulator n=1 Tax=Pedobacter helvus TaxID=2563444 RepID=A0ABW9JPH7_9SPHI|nr:GntR family transcriptional regulator [Pedobacter ureilyticus]